MYKRAAITLLGVFIALPSGYWLLSDAVVMFEMVSTGVKSRADLADDFGLGLLALFVVMPGTIIGAFITGTVVWRIMRPGRVG